MCIKEGLVVVKNLGGLGERKGVHLSTVAECAAFLVEALNEVSDLLVGEAHLLLATVGTGNLVVVLDQCIKRNNCLRHVVKRNVVRVAVSDVGLTANGKLGLDLVTNGVVVTNLLMLNVNVGIQLVEALNGVIQNGLKVGSTHGVIEDDSNLASVVATGKVRVCDLASAAATYKGESAKTHSQNEDDCYERFFHGRFLSY